MLRKQKLQNEENSYQDVQHTNYHQPVGVSSGSPIKFIRIQWKKEYLESSPSRSSTDVSSATSSSKSPRRSGSRMLDEMFREYHRNIRLHNTARQLVILYTRLRLIGKDNLYHEFSSCMNKHDIKIRGRPKRIMTHNVKKEDSSKTNKSRLIKQNETYKSNQYRKSEARITNSQLNVNENDSGSEDDIKIPERPKRITKHNVKKEDSNKTNKTGLNIQNETDKNNQCTKSGALKTNSQLDVNEIDSGHENSSLTTLTFQTSQQLKDFKIIPPQQQEQIDDCDECSEDSSVSTLTHFTKQNKTVEPQVVDSTFLGQFESLFRQFKRAWECGFDDI